MNQKQQNRLTMNKAVLAHLDAHRDLWEALPAFVRAHDELRDSSAARDSAATTQSVPSTGVTTDKEHDQEQAIKEVLAISRPVGAYALEQGNYTLYQQMNRSRSYLAYLPDNELQATLQAMLTEAGRHVDNLADYGVDVRALNRAQAAVGQLSTNLTGPRQVIDAGAAATQSIPALESAARRAIARLDGLIGQFTDRDPVFVARYRQARIVVDAGGRHGGGEEGSGNSNNS